MYTLGTPPAAACRKLMEARDREKGSRDRAVAVVQTRGNGGPDGAVARQPEAQGPEKGVTRGVNGMWGQTGNGRRVGNYPQVLRAWQLALAEMGDIEKDTLPHRALSGGCMPGALCPAEGLAQAACPENWPERWGGASRGCPMWYRTSG